MNINDNRARLQTARLDLSPFCQTDLDELAILFANRDFMRFSLGPYTREQTAAFIEKIMGWEHAGMPLMLAVRLRDDDGLLGYCGFFHHPEHGIEDVEIGYRLHPDYWNRGLITEGARAVRDHGFAKFNLPRVISLIHPENNPSRRVAEKNGMKVEKEIMFRGFPALVFAITKAQWLALNAA